MTTWGRAIGGEGIWYMHHMHTYDMPKIVAALGGDERGTTNIAIASSR